MEFHLILSLLFIIGCDENSDPASSSTSEATSCTTLMVDLMAQSEPFSIAMMEAFTTGEPIDATLCNAYAASAQAFVDGGCTACEANEEACLDDGSNEDTCCDEIDQAGVDLISAMCGG